MAYQNRAKRFDLSFPVEFTSGGVCLAGHCRNLSASGLLATFSRELELWTEGDLLLHYGEAECHLRGRTARVLGREAGFHFQLRGEGDRQTVDRLLHFAMAYTHLVGAPPF